ncbi:MAG TPA: heavy-metal-associated domain-containing protein [Candidatus Faecimonas intestinavium]|nr:heavy-metal-associated domain-containing protein [Candidatus Faecimonas intestinavium]
MRETIINVKGMVCGGCENRIKNALEEIKGVEKVEADYKTGIVKILANENIERKAMEDTIEDIGFEVVKEN